VFPYAKRTEAEESVLATVWFEVFKNVNAGDFGNAIQRWNNKSAQHPTPADIKNMLAELYEIRRKTVVRIPNDIRSPQDQEKINRNGIAKVRAAIAAGRKKTNNENGVDI